MGRATRKGAADLWAWWGAGGPRPPDWLLSSEWDKFTLSLPPANAPQLRRPFPRGAEQPRGRHSNCRARRPHRRQLSATPPVAPAPGSTQAVAQRRGTGRLRPNGPPAGGAKPGGPFGAEGAQHGHHLTGPLCAPEHLRGERPGRSRAGEKARPRSARRAWPCLFDGRRKRPHRCPAGAFGRMKRGRGLAGRRTAAGGERLRRRHRPPERGGCMPAWWPALPISPSALSRQRARAGGGSGGGVRLRRRAPPLGRSFPAAGERKEQRSALAVRCSFLDSADNDVHPVGPLSVYHDLTALSTLTLVRVFRRTGLASGRRCSPQRAAPAPTGAGGGWGLLLSVRWIYVVFSCTVIPFWAVGLAKRRAI